MKRLFYYMLRKYTNTESERSKVYSILFDKVSDSYGELTEYGDVYNAYIEFIMANDFIYRLIKDNDVNSLKILDEGLEESYDKAIDYIAPHKKLSEKISRTKHLSTKWEPEGGC